MFSRHLFLQKTDCTPHAHSRFNVTSDCFHRYFTSSLILSLTIGMPSFHWHREMENSRGKKKLKAKCTFESTVIQRWNDGKGFTTLTHIQSYKLINYFGHVCSQTITLHKSAVFKECMRIFMCVCVRIDVWVCESVFVDVSIRISGFFLWTVASYERKHVALGRKRKWSGIHNKMLM